MGGCVERIIDIVRGRETVDVAITSGQAAERDDIPEELRQLLRSLRDVKASEASEATNSLRTYLALVVFGSVWEEVRQILGPSGDTTKRKELLFLCFGSGDHSDKPGRPASRPREKWCASWLGLVLAASTRQRSIRTSPWP